MSEQGFIRTPIGYDVDGHPVYHQGDPVFLPWAPQEYRKVRWWDLSGYPSQKVEACYGDD